MRWRRATRSGVKRCRDGHILISVVTDQDFDRLAIAMGLPHLVADPRFSDGTSRYRHRDSIDAVLDPWLRSMDGDDIAGLAADCGGGGVEGGDNTGPSLGPSARVSRLFRQRWRWRWR